MSVNRIMAVSGGNSLITSQIDMSNSMSGNLITIVQDGIKTWEAVEGWDRWEECVEMDLESCQQRQVNIENKTVW